MYVIGQLPNKIYKYFLKIQKTVKKGLELKVKKFICIDLRIFFEY